MSIKNKVSELLKQYQTRQQLRRLPIHLFKDIGKTQENVSNELNKNDFYKTIVSSLRSLIKGD